MAGFATNAGATVRASGLKGDAYACDSETSRAADRTWPRRHHHNRGRGPSKIVRTSPSASATIRKSSESTNHLAPGQHRSSTPNEFAVPEAFRNVLVVDDDVCWMTDASGFLLETY